MAKSVAIVEEIPAPSTGRWYWKEESNSLEFQASSGSQRSPSRLNSATTGLDGRDKRGIRKKTLTFGDNGAAKKDRATSGKGQGKGQRQGLVSKSARSNAKDRANKETTVTLTRLKDVVLAALHEVNYSTDSFEMCLFGLEQFDEFLLGLLNYFACFFDKLALERKPKPMATEPSLSEKAAMAEIQTRMSVVQRKLSESYCVLILGIGLKEHHHMACGSQRVSSTYKDREVYETLYRFCVHVVWIGFRRKEYELINKEVGRMLRSDAFNPALRVKNAPDDEDMTPFIDLDSFNKDVLSPAEYRRQHVHRPAIASIINKRSPVLVSMLPTPKEDKGYLFGRMHVGSSGNIEVPPEDDDGGQGSATLYKKEVGILGESISQFNPTTLAPVGSEENEENEESDSKEESAFAPTPGNKTSPQTQSGGVDRRMPTGMSQAVTDVFSDDEDD
ncbi:protein phosphatase 1 regulatory subunit 36-like isoform X2 [Amphiura filiformis]|uniref:protein phosphatase 1 regulatory subunit 36-like isoform X2 n=1 Tax=Amphiura filiformis TaxID=82378 RepID=UPI003B211501